MCKTTLKYPILLVHGMGFRDNKHFCYWGRIPKILEQMDCKIYFGNQDSNATIATNGEQLAERISEILEETGAEKVNIIAHSKGGLDSRYAITTLGMGSKVASLTTLSTPHNGSKTIDLLLKFPKCLVRLGCFFVDLWFRILGDKKPHTYEVIQSFRTDSAQKFNSDVPNDTGVYYQSYAFIMTSSTSDLLMAFPHIVVKMVEGDNDGLLPPASVKWGEFKGTYKGATRRGISHLDEIDLRRRSLTKKNLDGICDITDLYKEIVIDLMKKGF